MPLREVSVIPPLSELVQFLASSITFMVHLEDVTVFLDDCCVAQVSKSLGRPHTIPIPAELKRLSPEENMMVKLVSQCRKSFQRSYFVPNLMLQLAVTINAKVIPPSCFSERMHEEQVNLSVFTAEVNVTVKETLSSELNRCTKKGPPSYLKYSLIYVSN